MGKYRTKAKIDNNQNEIVNLLRRIPGVTVALKHDDILVGYRNKNYWYEIKNPDKISKKTGNILDSAKQKDQIKFENQWTGHYKIVSSFEEIFEDINR